MAWGKTKDGEESKHSVTGIIGHAIRSMWGDKGTEDEKEQSTDYHQRRTDEELKGVGATEGKKLPSEKPQANTNIDAMSRKGDQLSENVHTAEGNTPDQVTHPALKTIMAKLNEKDEDEPASKGGYVSMGTKV